MTEFGTGPPRGRTVVSRVDLDRQLEALAGGPVSLPDCLRAYEAPSTCPACGSSEILWGCEDAVRREGERIHPVVWHPTEWMADSYLCKACDAGWIEPDEPEPISWVRPYWLDGS